VNAQDTYIQRLGVPAGIHNIASGKGHAAITFSSLEKTLHFFPNFRSAWMAIEI